MPLQFRQAVEQADFSEVRLSFGLKLSAVGRYWIHSIAVMGDGANLDR